MPFCRKCGRRLVEYSEVCTDCGTSTTAPIINTKRPPSTHQFKTGMDKKIAKALIPEVSPVQIKVISNKPAAKTVVSIKPTAAPIAKPVAPKTASPKPAAQTKEAISAPFKVATPPKPIEPPKPVLSAKHIIKPKKAKQTKPPAPFTIAHARPVAGLNIAPTPVPKFLPHPRPVAPSAPVAQPKPTPVPVAAPVVPPSPAPQPLPVIRPVPVEQPKPVVIPTPVIQTIVQPKPVAPTKPKLPPKPVEPAPVYPPHEIIQSKVSLKEDILAHPEDYEMQSFPFDLECSNRHFFAEGIQLPVSKGRAYCPQCGERLRKPKPKKRRTRRYHRY